MILIIIKSNKKQGLNIIKRKQDSKKKVDKYDQTQKGREKIGHRIELKR